MKKSWPVCQENASTAGGWGEGSCGQGFLTSEPPPPGKPSSPSPSTVSTCQGFLVLLDFFFGDLLFILRKMLKPWVFWLEKLWRYIQHPILKLNILQWEALHIFLDSRYCLHCGWWKGRRAFANGSFSFMYWFRKCGTDRYSLSRSSPHEELSQGRQIIKHIG